MIKDHHEFVFWYNKTPIEVIKEGAFGGTALRNIYSGINVKFKESHGKNLMS